MADSFTSSTVQSGESAAIVRKGVAIAGIHRGGDQFGRGGELGTGT